MTGVFLEDQEIGSLLIMSCREQRESIKVSRELIITFGKHTDSKLSLKNMYNEEPRMRDCIVCWHFKGLLLGKLSWLPKQGEKKLFGRRRYKPVDYHKQITAFCDHLIGMAGNGETSFILAYWITRAFRVLCSNASCRPQLETLTYFRVSHSFQCSMSLQIVGIRG